MEQLGTASRQVWTRRQALQVATADQVRQRVGTGAWQQPWPGVCADGGVALDAHQRAFAAVLASGGQGQPVEGPNGRWLLAVAAGRTAARAHGFVLVDDDDPATGAQQHLHEDVVTARDLRPLCQRAVVRTLAADGTQVEHAVERVLPRRRVRLGAHDATRTPSGLWLTSRHRTIVDCAQLLSHEAFVCLLDDALHRGLVSASELSRLVEERTWQPGALALRLGVQAADARAESPLETLGRLLLRPQLPDLTPQVRVLDRRGRVVARVDLGIEQLRLAVEADGKAGHAGEVMRARDRRRDVRTEALGWATERATWWDVRCGQAALVERVVSLARSRRG